MGRRKKGDQSEERMIDGGGNPPGAGLVSIQLPGEAVRALIEDIRAGRVVNASSGLLERLEEGLNPERRGHGIRRVEEKL